MSDLGLRVVGSRVLIKPDIDQQAVEATESGVLVAKTLEAAVTGRDEREAWYTGTVVALGDSDAAFDVRPFVLRRLQELLDEAIHCLSIMEIAHLKKEIEELPMQRAREFNVGDSVTFSAMSGHEITIDHEQYLMLDESDILGVLEAV